LDRRRLAPISNCNRKSNEEVHVLFDLFFSTTDQDRIHEIFHRNIRKTFLDGLSFKQSRWPLASSSLFFGPTVGKSIKQIDSTSRGGGFAPRIARFQRSTFGGRADIFFLRQEMLQ
jgi:hypothetical protein